MKLVVVWCAALLVIASCYNTRSVRISLANNPAGAECHARCTANRADHNAYLTCMSTCPGAQRGKSKCEARDLPPYGLCEYQTDVSKPKTYGLVILTAILVIALAAGG